MPPADPTGLTSTDWNNIHNWLTLLWIFFPLIITFAFCMMIAHAFIPSAVMTGHLPRSASYLRIPLTIIGLLALAAALVFFISAAFLLPEALRNFYGRFFL
jgi:hypothetical protein